MIELLTPIEIIQKAVILIENERKMQKLQQKELAQKADIPLPTYKQFIYSHKISFENLIKLFIALRLFDNLNSFLKTKEHQTLDEIKNKDSLPKRIVKWVPDKFGERYFESKNIPPHELTVIQKLMFLGDKSIGILDI